EWLPDIDDEG
ncbi:hypothetical protein MGO_06356, partial [Candida albicans P76055]